MPLQSTTHSGGNGFTKEESAKGISYPYFAQSTYHYLGLPPNFSRPYKPVYTYEVTLVKMQILKQRTPILCNILTLPVYFSEFLLLFSVAALLGTKISNYRNCCFASHGDHSHCSASVLLGTLSVSSSWCPSLVAIVDQS